LFANKITAPTIAIAIMISITPTITDIIKRVGCNYQAKEVIGVVVVAAGASL
jgi:hypothetical protein